jgi:hypothetical protein
LDTREKIVELSEAGKQVSTGKWTIVPGFFDPLTAVQARRISALNESGRKLAAIVLNTKQTFLSADARAALIAALRGVDLVAIAHDEEWRAAFGFSKDVRVVEDPQGEATRSADFVQFVIRRQKNA